MSASLDDIRAARDASSPNRAEARERDRADALAPLRNLFDLPADTIYLDGNSLGAMPRAVTPVMAEALTQGWSKELIGTWNGRDWHNLPVTIGDRLAALMGAGTGEVLACDSTSVNLYKVFCAAMNLRRGAAASSPSATTSRRTCTSCKAPSRRPFRAPIWCWPTTATSPCSP